MKLSIITINYNEASALQQTIDSVRLQTYQDYEHIIIDGGSTDESVIVIKNYAKECSSLKWVSEKDKGVYDAQNKGLERAIGEYCFFLNAGDVFAGPHVLEQFFSVPLHGDLLYGNLKVVQDGKQIGYCKGVESPTFLDLYNSCLKHQATFIRRSLFERFGVYDASLRIVAEWEWFLKVAAFHDDVSLEYLNVDVAQFNIDGISNRSPQLCIEERQLVLDRYMSRRMQADYLLLTKYRNVRYCNQSRLIEYIIRLIAKFAKYKYGV